MKQGLRSPVLCLCATMPGRLETVQYHGSLMKFGGSKMHKIGHFMPLVSPCFTKHHQKHLEIKSILTIFDHCLSMYLNSFFYIRSSNHPMESFTFCHSHGPSQASLHFTEMLVGSSQHPMGIKRVAGLRSSGQKLWTKYTVDLPLLVPTQ